MDSTSTSDSIELAPGSGGPAYPLADLHAHITEEMPIARAVRNAQEQGVTLGIVEHGGRGQTIGDDAALLGYVERLAAYPVYKGLQAEGLDWPQCFSAETLGKLDYVLSDALTFPDEDGTLVRLWRPGVRIDDAESFMERYVAFTVRIIASTPIDILANATFLPAPFADQYDALWTRARMERVIEATVMHGVAIEINSRYRLPSVAFIRLARGAGARFCFGSNEHGARVGRLDYPLKIARECGLTQHEIFIPGNKGDNPTASQILRSGG